MTVSAATPELDAVRQRQILVLLLLVTVFVAHSLYVANGGVWDDAYIAFRYSKNLAAGEGLRFQSGPPVEGYSCFTWVLLGAFFERIGIEPAVALPLVGIASGAGAVAVVTRAAQRIGTKSLGLAAGLLPGAWLATMPSLALYSGSGLETGHFALLVAITVVAVLAGRPRTTAAAAVLSVLARPEGAVVAGLALAGGLVRAPSAERRRWLRAGIAVGTVAVGYACFKWFYFGALLPNTAIAKPADLSAGLAYVGWGLIDPSLILALSLFAVIFREKGLSPRRLASIGGVALVAVAAVEGGDWMPGTRFLLPGFVALAVTMDASVELVLRGPRRARWVAATLAVGGLGLNLRGSLYDTRAFSRAVANLVAYERYRDDIATRMVADGVRSVGTLDIGRISYAAPSLRILDLGGLTDRAIAALPGDYRSKQIVPETLEARAPDAFLFTSRVPPAPRGRKRPPKIVLAYPVEQRLADSPWFARHYRLLVVLPIRPDYYLCWYRRAVP